MRRFIGITRERVFSPGRVEDDAAILMLVAERLRQLGYSVAVHDADEADWPDPDRGTLVFAMCQSVAALDRLQRWMRHGVRVINSPEGILNCQRYHTIAAFAATDLSFPASAVVETGTEPSWPAWLSSVPGWVKRGDVHATEADDVVAVNDMAAARAALRRFAERGIRRAVLQRHVAGIVLKFYAVRGGFFHCVVPEQSSSPYQGGVSEGFEMLQPPPFPFLRKARDQEFLAPDILRRVQVLGQRAAQILSVEIYGGDCVVDVNGALTLIDLNDWPSYAPCRAGAAAAIAAYVCGSGAAADR